MRYLSMICLFGGCCANVSPFTKASLIIIICRVLHYPLSKMRQPRVISEVIGGIILGPSVMGRIPGFRAAIFPEESIPNLNLVANLGLVLYLFMIGVETNLRSMLSNWRVAVSVSAAGMVLPFAFGCAIAYGLFNEFGDDPSLAPINFGTFMLFIGIAMAITVSYFLSDAASFAVVTFLYRLSPSFAVFLRNSSSSTRQ